MVLEIPVFIENITIEQFYYVFSSFLLHACLKSWSLFKIKTIIDHFL